MAIDAELSQLSDEDRRWLDSWRNEFNQNWDKALLRTRASRIRQLPQGSALRLAALAELIKIDMPRQWRGGRQVRLETYLHEFPELGGTAEVSPDLIFVEYLARQECSGLDDLEEYLQRFPSQAAELRRLADQRRGPAPVTTQRIYNPSAPSPGSSGRSPGSSPKGQSVAMLPERFGRYQIVKQLGQGGMGSVYLAQDTKLDRPVALKVPQFAPSDGPEALERFRREALTAAKLRHANLCEIYDVGVIGGVHYLTMAYIEGPCLASYIENHAGLSPRVIAMIVAKLARALKIAHEKDVIHRDLKPSNVMMQEAGGIAEPVIVDFGLAQRIDPAADRLTRTGQVIGTWAYMTPELLCGERDATGPSCDIYALGIILYELLTGRLPYHAPGQVVANQPDPPSMYREELDPRLEAICLKAMAKKQCDRYATMSELAKALSDYLRARTGPVVLPNLKIDTTVLPTPAQESARAQARKNKRLPWKALGSISAGVLLIAALAGGVLHAYRFGPNRAPALVADKPEPERPKPKRTKDSPKDLFEQALEHIRSRKVQEADLALKDYIVDLQAPNRDEALRLRAEIRWARETRRAKDLSRQMDDAQLKHYIENGVDDLTNDGNIQTPELRRVHAETLLDAFRAESDFRLRPLTPQVPIDPGSVPNGHNLVTSKTIKDIDSTSPEETRPLPPPPARDPADGYMRLVTDENLELWGRSPGQPVRFQGDQVVSTGVEGSFTTRRTYNLSSFRFDYLAVPGPVQRPAKTRAGTARAFVRIMIDKPMQFFGSKDTVSRIEFALTSEDVGKVLLFDRNGRSRGENPIGGGEFPPGRWHKVEIRCEEHKLRFLINDQEVNRLELDRTISSSVGFHFVSGQIHLANLRLSEQKPQVAEKRELPRGARAFAGKHFLIIKQSVTWTRAQDMCRRMDGHLAVVRDEAENRFLTGYLQSEGLQGAWLGASNKNKGRDWFWVDGTRVKYTHWDRSKGQPDDEFGLENSLLLSARPDANGTWFDEREEIARGFVCEWDY